MKTYFKVNLFLLLFPSCSAANTFDDEVNEGNDGGDDGGQKCEDVDQEVFVPREVVNWRLEVIET